MTTREDYDDDDWQLLADMPRLAAFGAMAAQDAGPVISVRELWAGLQELVLSAKQRLSRQCAHPIGDRVHYSS